MNATKLSDLLDAYDMWQDRKERERRRAVKTMKGEQLTKFESDFDRSYGIENDRWQARIQQAWQDRIQETED